MNDLNELVAYLSKAERGYSRMLNRAFQGAGHDLSREQYELLKVLWEEDNINQQAISRKIGKNKYNVTKLLNTLCKGDYVGRRMGKEDKRNNFIVLTEKGKEAEKLLKNIEEQVNADLTFTILPQEIKACVWGLKKLTDLMQ